VYHPWAALLPPAIELAAIQLPGRQNRIMEAPITDMPTLVETLAAVLAPLWDRPVALFGHSLGAVLAFEVARWHRHQGQALPVHLFVAGHRAPQLPERQSPIHHRPDADFLAGIARLNGTPPEILQHREILEMLLPVLRADFQLAETYQYGAETPLPCPITAFGGTADDKVSEADLAAWRAQAGGPFATQLFPGDHFFLNAARASLVQAVATALAPWS
jgi:medium-chain acyl-[acyl-carrier-protein] hydrolase